MVTEWGMSETLGNMYLGAREEVFLGRDYQTQLNYSDEVAAKIDAETKKILDAQYKVALETIKNNREVLDKMVRILFEKETIYEDEVDMLFEGKSVEEIIKETANRDKPVVTNILKKKPAPITTAEPVVEEPKQEEVKEKTAVEEPVAPSQDEEKKD